MKTYKIKVTNKHIKASDSYSWCCPIALAIREATPLKDCAVSSSGGLHFNKFYFTKLPLRARNFIYAFDSGKKVRPFSFLLKVYLNG